MSKIFALLALLLILSGALILAVPRNEPGEASTSMRSLGPTSIVLPDYLIRARDLAQQVNAPLSIICGLVSLYYSRRSYHVNKARHESEAARRG